MSTPAWRRSKAADETHVARSELHSARLSRIALALIVIALAPQAALAQEAEHALGLEVDACDAAWAEPEALAPALDIELRAAGALAHVEIGAHVSVLRVAGCDPSNISISLAGTRTAERVIDLRDVEGVARTRTLAIALVDLWLSPVNAPPPAPPIDPEPVAPPPPPALSVATLSLSLAGALEPELGPPLGGGAFGVTIRSPEPAIRASIAVSALYGFARDALGDVDFVAMRLSLGVEMSAAIGPLDLGGLLELRPGLGFASARAALDARASSAVDWLFDVALLARARLHFAEVWFVVIDAGVSFAPRGMVAQADGRSVIGVAHISVPGSIGIGADLF
jgi:hypothetical protein